MISKYFVETVAARGFYMIAIMAPSEAAGWRMFAALKRDGKVPFHPFERAARG